MITDTTIQEEVIAGLSSLLDEEIVLLKIREKQFDELYNVILHHDEDAMEPLLREMTDARQKQARLDADLDIMRTDIASLLGIPRTEITLRELAEQIGGDTGATLIKQRERLIILAEQLKTRHLNTAVLLTESMKINRSLLNSLIPDKGQVTTYGKHGESPWRRNPGLVDTEM